jgi:hypothetical protein
MNSPCFLAATLALTSARLFAADALTLEQKQAFLRTAKVLDVKVAKKGVTGARDATLSDGKLTHLASIQTINESRPVFQPTGGPTEFNFRDTYIFNIAAWKVARMLGIDDMVPVSIARSFQGQAASFTWYVDDVALDEQTRLAKKIEPPDIDSWNREIQVMHVFDQLIYNTDSNATNLLIDKQWRIWLIDHTRSFRTQKTFQDPKMLSRCDRNLLAKMKTLDEAGLQKELKAELDKTQIQALLARRDLLVKFFEGKGESVLFDRPSRRQ